MPPTHIFTYPVRFTDCDVLGHANHSTYARYMQEAAFEASAAVGYDAARYEALGHVWYVHETTIEYLRSLKYGDQVEIRTWVEDFRRVRSRRIYQMRRVGTGELVARAASDWVYVNRASGQPAIVPQEMIEAYAEAESMPGSPRKKYPPAPPPPVEPYTMQRRVEWRDVDSEGHVNNAVYFDWTGDCGLQIAAHYGWSFARMSDLGFAIVARENHIVYQSPAFYDDVLAITAYLADVTPTSATRHWSITRPSDGANIAQGRMHWVTLNMASGQLHPMPEAMLREIAPNVSSGVVGE
jgi:acyl-CoA thioester hydrolase